MNRKVIIKIAGFLVIFVILLQQLDGGLRADACDARDVVDRVADERQRVADLLRR